MNAPAGPPDLLRLATSRAGHSALDWLDRALATVAGPLLEVRAVPDRPGEVHLLKPGRDDPDARTVAPADRLPIAGNAVGAARAVLCLPVVDPLEALFAELRRVLRPAGTLAALVPSAYRPVEPFDWRPSARAARRALSGALAGHPGFRHEVARDRLGWLFASADFAVLTDQREVFWIPVPDAPAAEHLVAGLVPTGLWPPGVEPERLERARDALARIAGPAARVPIPLRLLVGRR